VNITKFGAFVNILPGRDGLLHISKIGGGKRIDRVEDVLALGDKVEVVVREIDDRGKVSLDLANAPEAPEGGGSERKSDDRPSDRKDGRGERGRDRGRDRGHDRGQRDRGRDRGNDREKDSGGEAKPGRTVVSFEDEFEDGLS
jgi:polyribonucleotide nucleotidyltransferase